MIWSKRHPRLAALVSVVVTVIVAAWLLYHWRYPFGWSHCCDTAISFALLAYADEHGGSFPAGETTPEASLSLLYPKYADADLLRGKTVPLTAVQNILARGDGLGPESCGWHYVQGLRMGDDPRLAILWDKVGLGHNGERVEDGGRIVIFLNGASEHIPGSRWESFLEEQQKLLAARKTR